MIPHGTWRIWPDYQIAQNIHNGSIFEWQHTVDGISGFVVNVPAQYMVDQIAEWLKATYFPTRSAP